ncbi:MAG: PAS domain-containing protein [Anaerolineae bacterium]|nr:PAS domain-containing protein [Anaerolineae bacterium]
MPSPQNPASRDPARPVSDMIQSVDALGENTGRLFGRLYGGLRRRQDRERQATRPGEAAQPDQPESLAQQFRQAQQAQAQNQAQIEHLRQLTRTQSTNIARLTGVLAVISEGVIMQDTEGRIVLMNQAARDLLGSVRHFWDSDLGRMFAAARHQRALDGEITLGQAQRVDVNDRVIGAQLAIVADVDGTRLGTVLMLRDVTRDALAERLKDQFVTQMSHELRTPITAIKGMSEVLLAMPEDQPPKRKFLEAISRNAAVLDRMIIELLDISEIGAGSFAVRRENIDLAELIFTVIKGLETRIEKADLQLSVMISNRERLIVTGDDRRLQWAIGHLLDNSVKYTEPGGEIVVRAGRIRDGHVLLEVSDTGVGISPRDLPHVFERFYRGEARTPDGRTIDPRGLGQGLFVARAVVDAHDGYLSVASSLGEGSTFTLALPVDGRDEPAPARPAAPPEFPPDGDPDIAPPPVLEPPIDPFADTMPSRALREVQYRVQDGDTDRANPLG